MNTIISEVIPGPSCRLDFSHIDVWSCIRYLFTMLSCVSVNWELNEIYFPLVCALSIVIMDPRSKKQQQLRKSESVVRLETDIRN